MEINKLFCYPNGSRKSMCFTIDDGNVPLDKKFIKIVKPAGILGTFNLNSNNMGHLSPEGYREMYRDYEIANHCKHHPRAFAVGEQLGEISSEPFSLETSDPSLYYKSDVEGMYYYHNSRYWATVATYEAYIKLIDDGKRELEEVFGEGSIVAFVWPYRLQEDGRILEYIKNRGYASARKTGCAGHYNLPSDRMLWSYNANHTNLLQNAAEFDALADDGELKFFSFGVHSHDFENNNCWDVLEDFAKAYGNRPNDFWYATVRQIFEYEDAVKSAVIRENEILNNSDISIYLNIDGKKIEILPRAVYLIK